MTRLSSLFLAVLVLLVTGWLAYALLTSNLPSVDDLEARVHGRLARAGAPYEHLDEVPSAVQQATIVTEDERFLSHHGVDVIGVLRAILDDVTHACLCEGGSTITQQLAKQVYLDGNDATFRRKLETILLATQIERQYSKGQILELYLNTAYYGHGAYGVGAAARVYWRRQVSQVDLAQAAMLAGLPQAPSSYDPLQHPDAARQRRAEVLARLVGEGRITADEARLAAAQPVAITPSGVRGTNPDSATSNGTNAMANANKGGKR